MVIRCSPQMNGLVIVDLSLFMKKTVFFSAMVTAGKYIGAGLATIGVAGAVLVLELFLQHYCCLTAGILLNNNVCSS